MSSSKNETLVDELLFAGMGLHANVNNPSFSPTPETRAKWASLFKRSRHEIGNLQALVAKALAAWEGTGPGIVLDELRAALSGQSSVETACRLDAEDNRRTTQTGVAAERQRWGKPNDAGANNPGVETTRHPFETVGEIASLMQPALEALPLQGHDWHELTVRVKRYEDGQLAVHGITLVPGQQRSAVETSWLCIHGHENAATETHCTVCDYSRKHTIGGVLHERSCGGHPCVCGAEKAICEHEWKIDGAHSNEYCGKCYIPKPSGEVPAPRCVRRLQYPGGESRCVRNAGHDGNCLF
jgi:hypothetical protein